MDHTVQSIHFTSLNFQTILKNKKRQTLTKLRQKFLEKALQVSRLPLKKLDTGKRSTRPLMKSQTQKSQLHMILVTLMVIISLEKLEIRVLVDHAILSPLRRSWSPDSNSNTEKRFHSFHHNFS